VNQYKKFKEDKVVAIEGWGTGDTEALTASSTPTRSVHLRVVFRPPDRREEDAVQLLLRRGLHLGATGGPQVPEGRMERETCSQDRLHLPEPPLWNRSIKGGKEYAKELGFEVLGDENVDLKAIEANSQLLSVKNKGADFAWIGGTTKLDRRHPQGCEEARPEDEVLQQHLGDRRVDPKLAGGAEEGALVMAGSVRYGDKVPGMALLMSVEKTPQVTHYIRGWVSMMVLVEALNRADKKGPITGESVKAALETFNDFDTGGLTPAKITFTSTDHRPYMSVNIMEMQNGKLVIKQTTTLPRKAEWLGL